MKRFTTHTILVLVVLVVRVVAGPGSETWPRGVFSPDTPFAGTPTGLEVDGDRVYVATDSTIAAFDVSDPAAPEFLGVSLSSGTTQRLTVSGGHAFLVGYHAGLNIHDLSDPTNGLPRLGGYGLTGSQSLLGVGVAGDRVFVSGHGTGLIVLDASSPAEPEIEGTAEHDVGNTDYFAAEHIRVVDDLIYMAGHDDDWGAFAIYRDVPGGAPEFLGDFGVINMPGSPPTGSSRRIEVNGSVAYINDTGVGLFMLDVSDPTAPKQIALPNGETTLTEFPVSDFALSGDLIITLRPVKLNVVDVSDPSTPVVRGEVDLDDLDIGFGARVAVSGTTAYIAGDQRLAVIDFSDADDPAITGSIAISGHRAQDVELVGDRAYVAGDSGIGVFDISDPAAALEIGRGGVSAYHSLVVDGNRAAAHFPRSSQIHFYDLGPEGRTPVLRDDIRESSIRHYDLEGDRFYMKRANQGITTYDVSDLSRVRQIGHWLDQDQRVDAFQVHGTTAFAGSDQLGFAIFDASDPNRFSLIGSLGGLRVSRFVIDGSLAYATRWTASSETELVVIVREGIREEQGRIDHLEARGTHLYLARGFLGLHVLDTSLELPRLTINRANGIPRSARLGWDAPTGVPFPVEGSRDLRNWTPLGRFTGDSLDEALGALFDQNSSLPAFFRATER